MHLLIVQLHCLGRQWATLDWERTEDQRRVCRALEEVAQQVGAKSIQAGAWFTGNGAGDSEMLIRSSEHSLTVAIAYVMHKTTHVFPIIGGRKVEQLEANIEALNVTLSEEQIKYLESSVPFDPGFPHTFCVSTAHAL